MDKLEDNRGTPVKMVTVEELGQDWLKAYARTGVKDSTVNIRTKELKIINRYAAKLAADSYTHQMHQKILNDLFDKNYAKSSIEGVHITAGMMFRHAIKFNYRKDDPCKGAVIPTRKRTVEEIEGDPIREKYFEDNELNDFFEALQKYGMDQDLERYYLLTFSGLRPGELLALKWTDVDFNANSIRVTKTLYNPKNNMREYELTPPKSEGSIRKISIDPSIMEMLKKYQLRQKKLKLATKQLIDDYHDANFVFCRPNGYPYVHKDLQNRMERILRKTKISKEATPHILRHTHISMLAAAGVDIVKVMKRVGHDDMDTTLKIYTHVTEKMHQSIDQKINTTFQSLLPKNFSSQLS